MTYAVIATWKMGAYGAKISQEILAAGDSAAKAAVLTDFVSEVLGKYANVHLTLDRK